MQDWTMLQEALKKLRQKDSAEQREKTEKKIVTHAEPKIASRTRDYLFLGAAMGLCIASGVAGIWHGHMAARKGYHDFLNTGRIVYGLGSLIFGLAIFGVAFAKWTKERAGEDAEAIAKGVIREYPEIAGEVDVAELTRLLTVVPIIESHLEPEKRAELDALRAKDISLQDVETLQAIGQILSEHLATNPGDLKMLTDAVQNKTMPWELVSQYSQEQQGARS